jgi:hypothetical protein
MMKLKTLGKKQLQLHPGIFPSVRGVKPSNTAWPWKMGPMGCAKMSVNNYQYMLLTTQKSKDLSYAVVEVWNLT